MSLYDYNYTMTPFICPHCNTLDHPYYVYYGIDGDGNVACSRGSWKVQRKFLSAPSEVHAQDLVEVINETVNSDISEAAIKGELLEFLAEFNRLALPVECP
eukprot:scaffold85649_cov42-Tisochrysis_lutea.AAC.1